MIKVEENVHVKFEYETEAERENHIKSMESEGYQVHQTYIGTDAFGYNHILATFQKEEKQKGYQGTPFFQK